MVSVSKTDSGKTYRGECTGEALETVQNHAKEADLTLFASCFCPFVQRVWVAFECLGVPYKYYEVDPYKKPKDLLEVSPKGLVPGLRLNNFNPPKALNESTVILEYINDLSESNKGPSLLPPITDPSAKRSHLTTFKDARALVRLQSDHINRSVVPAFYRFLQAQDLDAQISAGKEYHASIETLVGLFERMEKEVDPAKNGVTGEGEKKALTSGLGLWIDGNEDLGWVDVMVGPWLYRSKNVLKHYRGFELPPGTKFNKWLDRLFQHPYFRRTCSTDDLYLDSYERYAFNRPNTSQVANAINSGRGLP